MCTYQYQFKIETLVDVGRSIREKERNVDVRKFAKHWRPFEMQRKLLTVNSFACNRKKLVFYYRYFFFSMYY